jgi:tRNA (guanine37-N1)-methyltransferase
MEPDLAFEEKFNKTIETKGLIIPSGEIKQVLSVHKSLLLKVKHMSVVNPYEDNKKIILLNPNIEIPEELIKKYEIIDKKVDLKYSNFSYFKVLRQILPENIQVPTGFETVGHLAHFNLSDELYPYRHIIGKVLIDV